MAFSDIGSALNNSATGNAAAQVVATLAPASDKTAYIQGFTVTSTPPVSVESGLVTVAGVQGGPLYFQFTESSASGGFLPIVFPNKGIPGNGRGTAITVTLAAISSGGAGAVSSYGYQV